MAKTLNGEQVWGDPTPPPAGRPSDRDTPWLRAAIKKCAERLCGNGGAANFIAFICPFCECDAVVVTNVDTKQVLGMHDKIPCAKWRENELTQYLTLVNRQRAK